MADAKSPNPEAGTDAAPPEQDALFRMQMAVSDFVLGYWKYGGYLLGAVLLVALIYGGMDAIGKSIAERDYGAVADIDWRMPKVDDLARYGFAPMDDPNDAARMSDLAEGAHRYATAAEAAHGGAAVYAWLKAADAWKRAGKGDEALAALKKASAVRAGDLPGFTADSACGSAMLDAGETEAALSHFRDMAGRYQGFFAEESLIQLMKAQIQAGKADEAKATMDEFRKRFPESPRSDALASAGTGAG